MTALADVIAGGETLEVEFKRDVNDSEFVESVVCLANRAGGTLLVGVEYHQPIHKRHARRDARETTYRITMAERGAVAHDGIRPR